ncbi:MAG: pyrroloquinoline quinone-dependent dehydrogenase, partial [Trebonia sp.]
MARHEDVLDNITPVTTQMLREPPAADWLMWRGNYGATGYSRLDQINTRNAGDLGLAWSLTLPVSANEITPLVHDGVLFVESANTVEALNAANGNLLWQYIRQIPNGLHNGRDARMKSLAIYQDMLYAPTADGHVVALDVKTGKLIWDEAILTPAEGMHAGEVDGVAYHISGGPLVAHGKVVIGVSLGINTAGGDFIVGLDGQTGKELWRFHTIARPGQPGGDSWNGAPVNQRYGSGVWTVASYDPDLNQVYFGTGNTYDMGTLLLPHARKGKSNDALYTDSTLALNPDTGKLVWYYQHMNRDVWDLDWVFEQSLVDMNLGGKPRKLVITGGKIALFDAMDRATGKYAFSRDMGLQNLVLGVDPRTGEKRLNPELEPEPGKSKFMCPSPLGARNWPSTAVDPSTDVLYVPMVEFCTDYTYSPGTPAQTRAGGVDISFSGMLPRKDNDGKFSRLTAMDLKTGKVVWMHRQRAPLATAMLVTGGGLLFSGDRDRYFRALDEKTGQVLWQTRLNATPNSFPVTFTAGGQQYVAVATGSGSSWDG